jgi:hypothetical protein
MKVARIVMQFSGRAKDFQKLRDRSMARSLFLKKLLAEYDNDKGGYRARVKALLGKAVSCGADVVAFPACAFIYQTPAELRGYMYGSSKLPLVAAGALDRRSKSREHIVAFDRARRLPTPDYGPYVFDFQFGRCAFAISSSVKKLVDVPADCAGWTGESSTKPLLVLDMGHQQYPGRYSFFTLPRVQEHAAPTSKKTFVVLAWWRWSGGNPTGRWASPSQPEWLPEGKDRLREKHGDNEDFIDFFDVKW